MCFTKQVCRRIAATLSEAETLQGQISSLANKRSNRCHALSAAVEIIVSKIRKDELR